MQRLWRGAFRSSEDTGIGFSVDEDPDDGDQHRKGRDLIEVHTLQTLPPRSGQVVGTRPSLFVPFCPDDRTAVRFDQPMLRSPPLPSQRLPRCPASDPRHQGMRSFSEAAEVRSYDRSFSRRRGFEPMGSPLARQPGLAHERATTVISPLRSRVTDSTSSRSACPAERSAK